MLFPLLFSIPFSRNLFLIMQLSHVFSSIINTTSFKFLAPFPHNKGVLKSGSCSNSHFSLKSRNLRPKKMNKPNKATTLEEGDSLTGNSSSDSVNHSSLYAFESTLNKLSKWIVVGIFGLVILWKHDAEVLWAATGSFINSWLSISLKKMLNHARPMGNLRSDPGMPSSHAQSIFYASAFVVISLIHWLGVNVLTLMLGAAVIAFGSYFSWLRVSQQLHTTNQVLVGAVLGSLMAIVWFWLWHEFVFHAFISSIWVRIFLVLGSVSFCGAFVIYVIKNWLGDDR